MKMKYRSEFILYAASGDVENFIKEVFGKTFDVNVDQGGDASHGLIEVDVVDTGLEGLDRDEFIEWKQRKTEGDPWGEYLLESILNVLSEMGHIPPGTWHIRIE